jgi:hypothetical protein
VASLSFDLKALVARKKLLNYVYMDRREFEESGEHDEETREALRDAAWLEIC